MFSFKKGVLTINRRFDVFADFMFEVCFVLSTISIYSFNNVSGISPFMIFVLFASSIFVLFSRRNPLISIPRATIWYGVVILFAALSGLWATYFSKSAVEYLIRMVIILLMITAISFYIDNAEQLERISSLFIFSMLIITALEMTCLTSENWLDGYFGSKFSGANSNNYSFWAACAALLAFYKAYIKDEKKYYWAVVLFVACVMLSSSRKAVIIAVAGIFLIVLTERNKKNYWLRIIIISIAAVMSFVFVMTNKYAYELVGYRFASMINYYSENRTTYGDSSLFIRENLIQTAKNIFFTSPIVGRGIYSFGFISVGSDKIMSGYSHNNYWEILADFGIVGLVIYYSFYVYMIAVLIKKVFIQKVKICIPFFVIIVLLAIMEYGIVSIYSKYCQLIIAITFTATYVNSSDERKYKYIDNIQDSMKSRREKN